MSHLLALDPGNERTAFVVYNTTTKTPDDFGLLPNHDTLDVVNTHRHLPLAIEMVASYGMPVGATIFDTCVWVGRFVERHNNRHRFVYRRDVKLHLCNSARAKDANVMQALIDRYGGTRRAAVGVKAAPGPLYGFKADLWAALGVAVTAAETMVAEHENKGLGETRFGLGAQQESAESVAQVRASSRGVLGNANR